MKRYLVTITGRANLGYKGNKLRERDLCCSYVYGKNKAEAISKFWEQISNCSGLKGFERRDFKITAERWEKEADLDVNGNPLTDLEWAIPFDLLASIEMMHDEHFKNYKLDLPESLHEPQESSEPVAQENIQPELEDATESISEPQRDNRWNVSVFFSKGQILDELFRLKNDLSSGDVVGCTKRHEHQMNRFIKALDVAIDCINEIDELSQKASQSSSDEEKEITQENAEELTEAKPEHQRDVSLYSLGYGDKTFILVKEREENGLWAYYSVDSNELLWSSAERFSQDDLTRMYENGYFMSELVAKRKNKALALELFEKNGAPSDLIVEFRNSLSEIDDEIARLY